MTTAQQTPPREALKAAFKIILDWLDAEAAAKAKAESKEAA